MRTLPTLGLAVLLLSSSPVMASLHAIGPDEGQQKLDAQMPPTWRSCLAASDCVLLSYDCGEAIGINTIYLSQAKKLAYQIVGDPTTMNCAPSPGASGEPPHYVVGCIAKRCEASNTTE